MKVSFFHGDHGADPKRSRCLPPPPQGARGARGHVDVRLHSARGRQSPGPPEPPGHPRSAAGATGSPADPARRRPDSCRTRRAIMVLDASAIIELILSTPAGRVVAARIADPAESLHAPHLADVEVAQALRRYVRERQIDEQTAATALSDLRALDLQRHAHEPLLDRVWDLRRNLTAYDAVYVALAQV